jgi:hypothetical protein
MPPKPKTTPATNKKMPKYSILPVFRMSIPLSNGIVPNSYHTRFDDQCKPDGRLPTPCSLPSPQHRATIAFLVVVATVAACWHAVGRMMGGMGRDRTRGRGEVAADGVA